MSIPPYMQKGSTGPVVTVLQVFLCGVLKGSQTPRQIVYDQNYGAITAQLVREFQTVNQLEVTGNWNPETSGCAKREYSFDFEAAAVGIYGTPISTFVQPKGNFITWPQMTGR